MTEYEKMQNGFIYDALDPKFHVEEDRCHKLCEEYNNLSSSDSAAKQKLLLEMFETDSFDGYRMFGKPIFIDNAKELHIGKRFYANAYFTCVEGAPVYIGDDVLIGPHCTIATGIHSLLPNERRISLGQDGKPHDYEYGKSVTIGNNVWIASNVTIIGGAKIGDGSVIGAGSVVTKEIPAGVFAAGNPCKVIRKLTEEDSIYKKAPIFSE